MALTPVPFDSTDPLTIKYWSRDTRLSVGQNTVLLNPKNKLSSKGHNTPFFRSDKLDNNPGDTVTDHMFHNLAGRPRYASEPLWDREHAVEFDSFEWKINQVRNGFQLPPGRMSKKRVSFDAYQLVKDGCGAQLAQYQDVSLHMQLAGAKFVADSTSADIISIEGDPVDPNLPLFTGCNDVEDVDPYHYFAYADGGAGAAHATDQAVQADNTAYLDTPLVDKLITSIKTQPTMKIRPIMYQGKPFWILVIAPEVSQRMREADTALYALLTASLNGGFVAQNPIFTGALGEYNNIVFMESPWVPPGHHSTTFAVQANVRRNFLLGADALVWGWSMVRSDDNKLGELVEEPGFLLMTGSSDWGERPKVAWTCIWGAKAITHKPPARFRSSPTERWRYGSMVVSSYVPARPKTITVQSV